LSCRLVEDEAALRSIGRAWDELVSRSEFPNVFATSGFARAWWRAFGGSRRLRLLVVEDGSRVRLIAPFYSDADEPGTWRLIGDPRADYMDLLFAAGDGEALDCLFDWMRRRRAWNSAILRRLPASSDVLGRFPTAVEPEDGMRRRLVGLRDLRSLLAFRLRHDEHPGMDRAAIGRMAGLVEQAKYRHAFRLLSQRGVVRFEALRERDAISRRLGEFMEQHVTLWASKGDRSQFQDEDSRKFFAFLIEELSPEGAVRLDTLTLDGRLIAGHFGFTWGGRLHYYKPCYDIAVASHPGPGKLLLAHMIRQAWLDGLTELDLGQGNEPYKKDYASGSRPTASLLVRRSRLQTAIEWARGGKACSRCGKRIACPHIGRR